MVEQWAGRLGIPLVVFIAIAPTLAWLEFSGGSENLNVATVLEMRRTGHWMVPTLQGLPRLAKPPLTAWITAFMVSDRTLAEISSPEAEVRESAYRRLAWQVRWPTLLLACVMVLAVHELGRVIGGSSLGITAALVCATNYAFLRFSRNATTDVHLAAWVAVGSALLAQAVLRRRFWLGCVGGGIALGLAFMSKGPVAWVQTIIPVGAFLVWRALSASRSIGPTDNPGAASRRPAAVAMLVGLTVMLLVALPWFGIVIRRYDALDLWWREVTREGATDKEPSQWYNYVSIFAVMLPWSLFFLAGLALSVLELLGKADDIEPLRRWAGSREGGVLALLLLLVPILIMSFFRDRNERYLLPMIGPASIVTARMLLVVLMGADRPLRRALVGGHWLLLVAAAVMLPLLGATGWRGLMLTRDGRPWYQADFAAVAIVIGGAMLIIGAIAYRRRAMALVGATAGLMLFLQSVFMLGYQYSHEGRSEFRPLAREIWERYPGAELFSYRPRRLAPEDLSIYLNRPVLPTDDPLSLGRGNDVRILLVYERDPDARFAVPPGMRYLATVRRGRGSWHAYYWFNAEPPATMSSKPGAAEGFPSQARD